MQLEIRNEKGYSLLVVLLVVTFIMIIAASFVTASISNAKQEKTVDTNNLAVVAAEMGVDHYKTIMLNEFINRREDLIKAAQSEVNKLVAGPALTDPKKEEELQRISRGIGQLLKGFFEDKIQQLPVGSNETKINGDTRYSKNELSVELSTDEVIVQGEVIGYSANSNPAKLQFDLKFELLDLSNVDIDGSIIDNVSEVDFDNLPIGTITCDSVEDLNNPLCKFKNLDNSSVYFPGGYKDKNVNNNDFNNSTIYSGGDINVDNMNTISNVTFIVKGNFKAKNLNGDLGLNNSKIMLSGKFEAENTIVTNSTIITNDDFIINGKLDVHENSTICVAGDFKVNDHLTIYNPSKIYVIGNINYKEHNSSEAKPVKVNSEEFKLKCPTGISANPDIEDDWNEPIIDVEY